MFRLGAGGKPFTWLAPERLLELIFKKSDLYVIWESLSHKQHYDMRGFIQNDFFEFSNVLDAQINFRKQKSIFLGSASFCFRSWLISEFFVFSFFTIFSHEDWFFDVLFSISILHQEMKLVKIKYLYRCVFCKITFSQNECWTSF